MKVINFIPYGTRLGFHGDGVAATMMANDYKFFQCVCYEREQSEMSEPVGCSEQEVVHDRLSIQDA